MKTPEDHVNQLVDQVQQHQRRIRELEQQLADLLADKLPEWERLDPATIYVESLVASHGNDPRVNIRWFTHFAQLSVEEAREIAYNLIEACEASMADSFIATWLMERVGVPAGDQHVIGGMLMEFREHREQVALRLKARNGETEIDPANPAGL